MNWDEYNKLTKLHFQREIKDFVSFVIYDLDIDYKARILEIGCGPGWVSLELARRLPEVDIVGLEQSSELVRIAHQNKLQHEILNISFINTVFDNLKIFTNRSFDVIISFKGFHRWSNPQGVLNEIKRILKKQGKYAIIDYRKDLNLLAKASMWFTAKTMSIEFSSHWKTTLMHTYSLEEIVKILMQTKLKDWKIRTTLFDYLIYKI